MLHFERLRVSSRRGWEAWKLTLRTGRLKSIKNIEKITKTMKIVASTKLTRAQKAMGDSRTYGQTSEKVFESAETKPLDDKKTLLVVCSSDKGLCGGIHSGLSRASRRILGEHPDYDIAIVGEKCKAQLSRSNAKNIVLSFAGIGKDVPTFADAQAIADQICLLPEEYGSVKILYNKFINAQSYEATPIEAFSEEAITQSPNFASFEIDDEVLGNLREYSLANALFWALAEGHACEQSARRNAMDVRASSGRANLRMFANMVQNASKNAGDMISRFTILYNRTRQAVITGELVEIITVRAYSVTCCRQHADHITGCYCFRKHVNTFQYIQDLKHATQVFSFVSATRVQLLYRLCCQFVLFVPICLFTASCYARLVFTMPTKCLNYLQLDRSEMLGQPVSKLKDRSKTRARLKMFQRRHSVQAENDSTKRRRRNIFRRRRHVAAETIYHYSPVEDADELPYSGTTTPKSDRESLHDGHNGLSYLIVSAAMALLVICWVTSADTVLRILLVGELLLCTFPPVFANWIALIPILLPMTTQGRLEVVVGLATLSFASQVDWQFPWLRVTKWAVRGNPHYIYQEATVTVWKE